VFSTSNSCLLQEARRFVTVFMKVQQMIVA